MNIFQDNDFKNPFTWVFFIVQNFCKKLIHMLVYKTVFSVNNLHRINLDSDMVVWRCLLVLDFCGGKEGRSFHIYISKDVHRSQTKHHIIMGGI